MSEKRPFRRGSGPLVSILIPSRGRPHRLVESILSLYDLAEDPSRLEFLIKADEDDPETVDEGNRLTVAGLPVRTYVSERGEGWLNTHCWVNELSEEANGDWLFPFDDGSRMTTPAWDEILASANISGLWHGCDDICLFSAYTLRAPTVQEFPIVRRGVFEVLGHLSRHPQVSAWVWRTLAALNSAFMIPVQVFRPEHLPGDQTSRETVATRDKLLDEFDTFTMVKERLADAGRLLDHIDKYRGDNDAN